VVGLSDKPGRDSHRVAAYLKRRGYKIFPVNPTISLQDPVPQGSRGMGEETLGERSYPRPEDILEPIDMADISRARDMCLLL
jgi:hypothetical protein